MTEAAHIHTGKHHVVGVVALRVMLLQESESVWYAQGLEVNYIAQGTSVEDAKISFEKGLRETISLHLQHYNSLEKLLEVAPQDVWDEFFKCAVDHQLTYSQVSFHTVNDAVADDEPMRKRKQLPFSEIQFLQACA